MKKVFKIFVIILITVFMFGCTKTEGTLTIDSSKNVNLDITIVANKDFDTSKYLDNVEAYKLRGLEITKKEDNNYVTYYISKKYSKLDDISSKDDVIVDLSRYLDKNYNDNHLFKIEDNFLTDRYYANFIVDNDKMDKLISDDAIKITPAEFVKIVQDIFNNSLNEHKSSKVETTYTSEENILSIDDNITYSVTVSKDNKVTKISASNKYYEYVNSNEPLYIDITEEKLTKKEVDTNKNSDIKFIVNLPVKTISNNADEVSNDGKTLTWIYNKNRKNEVKFSFELQNKLNYISVFGIGLLIIFVFALVIYFSFVLRDKKREKIEKEPVYKSETPIPEETVEPVVEENIINGIPTINETPEEISAPTPEEMPMMDESIKVEEVPSVVNIDEK